MTALVIETAKVFEPLLQPSRYKGVHGGRGCIHPDTIIDTPFGGIKVSEFTGGLVYAWHNNKIVIASATASKSYTNEQLYLVTLKDGRSISVTDHHKFLTQRGWVQCCDISMFDEVVTAPMQAALRHRQSISDTCLQELPVNAQHLNQTHASCQDDCSLGLSLYDLQPQTAKDTDLTSVPLLSDAQQHNHHALTQKDDQEFSHINILSSLLHHLSNLGAALVEAEQSLKALENCNDDKTSELLLVLFRFVQLFHEKNSLVMQDLGLSLHDLYSCILKNQGENQQKALNIQPYAALDIHPLNDLVCYEEGTILTGISSICKHEHVVYWDLHVPYFENYLSNGIVNHNSGKSHFYAECVVERHYQKKTDTVCVREIQKSLNQSVKKLIESKIDQFQLNDFFEIQESVIKDRRGGLMIFNGMQNHTSDSIKSLEGFDIAWCEEAQSLSQRSLDLLRPTIRKPESEIWFSWNPEYETDPIDAFLRGESVPESSIVIEANYYDNPKFPDVLKDEMEFDRARDYDKYLHVWEGKYKTNSDSRVFKNWKVQEFDSPDNVTYYLGADWGFSVDPSVLIRCRVDGRKLYIDYEAHMVGCEIDQLPMLFDRVPDSRKFFITADSARPETISYMQRHGFPKINKAQKGKGSIEDGIEFLQSFDIIVHPRCVETIKELTMYSYKVDKLTGQVQPHLEDKENHVIDALRYSLESARKFTKTQNRTIILPKHTYRDRSAGY